MAKTAAQLDSTASKISVYEWKAGLQQIIAFAPGFLQVDFWQGQPAVSEVAESSRPQKAFGAASNFEFPETKSSNPLSAIKTIHTLFAVPGHLRALDQAKKWTNHSRCKAGWSARQAILQLLAPAWLLA